jgi:DNA replication protein DnaC
MFINNTIDKFNQLKLYGMAQALETQLGNIQYQDLAFEERIEMIIDQEKLFRQNKKLSNLLKRAKLRYSNACIEDIDFRKKRDMKKREILFLAQNNWIRNKQNIIISGPTGVGKSYLACALANSSCRDGFSVLYLRVPKFVKELSIARLDGSYLKKMAHFSKIDILIFDDWGIDSLNNNDRRDFLEIFEDRHNIRSVIITTQLPTDSWHEFIGDPTIADAICDRVIHNAHHVKLKGGSMRKELSNLTSAEQFNNLEIEEKS